MMSPKVLNLTCSSIVLFVNKSKSINSRLVSSQRNPPNAQTKVWIRSLGAAPWPHTAPQERMGQMLRITFTVHHGYGPLKCLLPLLNLKL